MLKEEGINFDAERGGYVDENNNLLDIDINRILEEYMEHMDRAYEMLNNDNKSVTASYISPS